MYKFTGASLLIFFIVLIATLSGCAPTSAKIVLISDFCTGRYYSVTEKGLKKADFDNIDKIRADKKLRETMDKFIDYATINEKEFKICQKE